MKHIIAAAFAPTSWTRPLKIGRSIPRTICFVNVLGCKILENKTDDKTKAATDDDANGHTDYDIDNKTEGDNDNDISRPLGQAGSRKHTQTHTHTHTIAHSRTYVHTR